MGLILEFRVICRFIYDYVSNATESAIIHLFLKSSFKLSSMARRGPTISTPSLKLRVDSLQPPAYVETSPLSAVPSVNGQIRASLVFVL